MNPFGRQAFSRPVRVEQLGAEYDVTTYPVSTRITEGKQGEDPAKNLEVKERLLGERMWVTLNDCSRPWFSNAA